MTGAKVQHSKEARVLSVLFVGTSAEAHTPAQCCSQPGGQSCRSCASSAVILLAGEMGETQSSTKEIKIIKCGQNSNNFTLVFLLWLMRNEWWTLKDKVEGLQVGGKCLYLVAKASKNESPWKECRRRGCDASSTKAREVSYSPSHPGLTNETNRRCRTIPLRTSCRMRLGRDMCLSHQSHLQKLQECLLK